MAAQLFSQSHEPPLNKPGAPTCIPNAAGSPQLGAQRHRSTARDVESSQSRENSLSAHENITDTAADLEEDEANIYDEVDLEEIMSKLQADFSDLASSQKQLASDITTATMNPPQNHPHTTSTTSPSYTGHIHFDSTGRARAITDPVDVYSTLLPKSEMISKETAAHVPVSGRGYESLEAVKNTLCGESGEMIVGRRGHTHEMISEEQDDVFRQESSNPTPKGRSRLSTAPGPKVSPKPKPRRHTNSTKLESEEKSVSKIQEVVASSNLRDENNKVMTGQSQLPPPSSNQSSSGRSYVNIELRQPPVKSKKPPRSPPMSRGPHSTSSPVTKKKTTPPVAPKPGHRRR